MQKFNTKSILSKFDFYEYESNNSANDNLDVFNPYDNSLIKTLPYQLQFRLSILFTLFYRCQIQNNFLLN